MAYSLSGPDAPSVIGEQEARQRDTAMTMAIQSLAMDRLRSSVRSLSRETNFESRPMENFAYAPLFIPKYRQWSNELQKIVGTDAPKELTLGMGSNWSQGRFNQARTTALRAIETPDKPLSQIFGTPRYSEFGSWMNWVQEYRTWQEQQRNLPV
jgi:hypothetical protein